MSLLTTPTGPTGRLVLARPVVLARVALAAAVVASTVALTDAVTVGATGHPSVFLAGPGWLQHTAAGAHGVMFALFAVLLTRLGAAVDRGRRVVRWVRRCLVVAFALLAIPYLAGIVLPLDHAPVAVTVPLTLGFVAALVVSPAFGMLLARRADLRAPAMVLASGAVALAGVLALAALEPAWAHPGYVEVPQYLGTAYLLLRLAPATVRALPGARTAARREGRPAGAGPEAASRQPAA